MEWSIFKRGEERDVVDEIRTLRAELKKKRDERDEIKSAPIALVDRKAGASAKVAQLADRYRKRFVKQVIPGFDRVGRGAAPQIEQSDDFTLLPVNAPGYEIAGLAEVQMAWCFFFGDQILKVAHKEIEAQHDKGNEGLPVSVRNTRVAELTGEILELEAREKTLLAEIDQLTVAIRNA